MSSAIDLSESAWIDWETGVNWTQGRLESGLREGVDDDHFTSMSGPWFFK